MSLRSVTTVGADFTTLCSPAPLEAAAGVACAIDGCIMTWLEDADESETEYGDVTMTCVCGVCCTIEGWLAGWETMETRFCCNALGCDCTDTVCSGMLLTTPADGWPNPWVDICTFCSICVWPSWPVPLDWPICACATWNCAPAWVAMTTLPVGALTWVTADVTCCGCCITNCGRVPDCTTICCGRAPRICMSCRWFTLVTSAAAAGCCFCVNNFCFCNSCVSVSCDSVRGWEPAAGDTRAPWALVAANCNACCPCPPATTVWPCGTDCNWTPADANVLLPRFNIRICPILLAAGRIWPVWLAGFDITNAWPDWLDPGAIRMAEFCGVCVSRIEPGVWTPRSITWPCWPPGFNTRIMLVLPATCCSRIPWFGVCPTTCRTLPACVVKLGWSWFGLTDCCICKGTCWTTCWPWLGITALYMIWPWPGTTFCETEACTFWLIWKAWFPEPNCTAGCVTCWALNVAFADCWFQSCELCPWLSISMCVCFQLWNLRHFNVAWYLIAYSGSGIKI